MIISISGTPGSGKSTIAEYLAKKLNMKFYSVGEIAREIAAKKHIRIDKLSELAIKNKQIDMEIDKIHKILENEDNFVIDSRIAFKFFPSSLKIFVYCRPRVAAERIFNAKRKTEKTKTLKDVLQEIKKREKLDVKRYKNIYGVNFEDKKNYEIVFDTSNIDKKEMFEKILSAVKSSMH